MTTVETHLKEEKFTLFFNKKVNLIARNNLIKATISKYNINAQQVMFENESMAYTW